MTGRGKPSEASLFEQELPKRLRSERQERNLSVRELARRLGVSASAVSQIETGRARPSVSMLYAIVSELGMSLDDLFAAERAGEAGAAASAGGGLEGPVQRAGSRATIALESGVKWERLTPANDPDIDFLYVTYSVGGSSSSDGTLIRHGGREYGLVLRGRLEVAVGFDTYELSAGDSIKFDSMMPHRLTNVGDEPVEAVWFVLYREHDSRAGAFAQQGGRQQASGARAS